jgi:hypothetical protein
VGELPGVGELLGAGNGLLGVGDGLLGVGNGLLGVGDGLSTTTGEGDGSKAARGGRNSSVAPPAMMVIARIVRPGRRFGWRRPGRGAGTGRLAVTSPPSRP